MARALSKLVRHALRTHGCGCESLHVSVRSISFSPRQVTSDAGFHSVSFSETDHPKVLITGMKPCSLSLYKVHYVICERLRNTFVKFLEDVGHEHEIVTFRESLWLPAQWLVISTATVWLLFLLPCVSSSLCLSSVCEGGLGQLGVGLAKMLR